MVKKGRRDAAAARVLEDLIERAGGCAVVERGFATWLEHHGANINDPLWSTSCLITSPDLIKQITDIKKPDATYFDLSILKKPDATYFDSSILKKPDSTYFDSSILHSTLTFHRGSQLSPAQLQKRERKRKRNQK